MSGQKHIGRFEVSVNNPEVVKGLDCFQYLALNSQRFNGSNRTREEAVSEGLTVEQFQYQDESRAVFKNVVDLADAGMIYASQGSRFAPKSTAGPATFIWLVDGLHCDRSKKAIVPSLVYNTHSALANLPPNPIVANTF
jgi:hypothetical protein